MNQTKLLSFNPKPHVNGNVLKAKTSGENESFSSRASIYFHPNHTASNQIALNSFSIVRGLGALAFALVFTSSALKLAHHFNGSGSMVLHKLVKLFYVDLELNVPAFFSMLLLLFAACLLSLIALLKRRKAAEYVFHWALLSAGFLFMAFDEIIAVHERMIEPMRDILGGGQLGVLYFAWVVPALALVSFLGFFFLRFLRSLPQKTRISFVVAAVIYLGAAVGLELIEGSHSEINGKDNVVYIFLTTLEETLEMIGLIVFIRALLVYLAEYCKELRLRIEVFKSES